MTDDANAAADSPLNSPANLAVKPLSFRGGLLVLACAFLGWMLAGMQLSMTSLANKPAATELLGVDIPASGKLSKADDAVVAKWFGWLKCGFLSGAALGGLLFGRLGDQWGRSKAMGLSILCYAGMSGLAYFATGPWQFLVLRTLAGLGVGGMWPNGVSLVAEAWSDLSRPALAGVMGTAANVGILVFARIAVYHSITPESWRWVMLIGAAPLVLGVFVLLLAPESPRWLASRGKSKEGSAGKVPRGEVFRPPLLKVTLIGIALASVPLIGGWGSSNWVLPWADQIVKAPPAETASATGQGEQADSPPSDTQGKTDPKLKAHLQSARALTGTIGSLLGGWLASLLGRRVCYFLMSLFALGSAQYMFWFLDPGNASFLYWFAALGFFSGVYFGWLPLCLPELFATRVRSTGAGVCFNFGRILTVATVLGTSQLIYHFQSNYALIGRVTSLIYLVGMVVILLPNTSSNRLED